MSYRRRFTRTVAVPYSGSMTVRYPASEHGGSMPVHYDGTAYENVEVEIEVDTDDFDSSVSGCNKRVNALTDSVVELKGAQCKSIIQNGERVSQTIIDGFFNTVRTDLSAQQAELQQKIDSRLMLLRQQAASLQEKQKQMENDYARTSARYQKLFDDLNNELSVRIHEVDQPIFGLVKDVDTQSDRMLHTDMIQTAVTMSKESSMLQAQITAANVKHHALEAMSKAQNFLTTKAVSDRTLESTTIEGKGDDRYLIPVCYMKTESENSSVEQKCVIPDYYASKNPNIKDELCERLERTDLNTGSKDYDEELKSYVQSEIGNNLIENDEHSNRVRNLINLMLNK